MDTVAAFSKHPHGCWYCQPSRHCRSFESAVSRVELWKDPPRTDETQRCDGFPYIDQSHDRLLPVPDNAVLYLWNANTPAHSWTTVTDDAELVAGLCTQFFMWEQPFYNYINRSAFLEDMCSVGPGPEPDPDTREFCSPALVNAICALGCMSSRHPGAFKYPGDLRSRGHHFIEEAERIIRKEELETPRLSTMQVCQNLADTISFADHRILRLSGW